VKSYEGDHCSPLQSTERKPVAARFSFEGTDATPEPEVLSFPVFRVKEQKVAGETGNLGGTTEF